MVGSKYSGRNRSLYFIIMVFGIAGISYEASQAFPFYVNMILVSISLVATIYFQLRNIAQKKGAVGSSGSSKQLAFLPNFGIFAFLVVPWIQFVRGIAPSYESEYVVTLLTSFAILAGTNYFLAMRFISRNTPNIREGKIVESVKTDFVDRYGKFADKIKRILFFDGQIKRGGAWVRGFSRSIICVDQSFWNTLSAEERDVLLLHEVGHMKSRGYILSISYSAFLIFLNSLRFSGVIYFSIIIPTLFGGTMNLAFVMVVASVIAITALAFVFMTKVRKLASKINSDSQLRADSFAYEHFTGSKEAVSSLLEKLRNYGLRNLDGQRLLLFESNFDRRIAQIRDKP